MKDRQRPRASPKQLDGEVTVRRFAAPQLRTTATIRKGKLVEPIGEVADRIGVDMAKVEGIVDAQGLALFGKLQHGAEVFLAGAVAPRSSHENATSLTFFLSPPDVSVAWAYDPRMLLHIPPIDRVPETPYRLQRALEFLRITPRAKELLPKELLQPMVSGVEQTVETASHPAACWLPPRLATLEEISLCHDVTRYRDFIETGTALSQPLKSDVYCSDGTSSVATRLAVAAVIDAARCSLRGAPSFAFCLVRPPGHHCSFDTPSGFCLANNVGIAARQLLQDWRNDANKRGNGASTDPPRIAIIDLDVHHGEGTQGFVEEEPPSCDRPSAVSPLLYLSLHRYDHGLFYPNDPRGDTSYVGRYRNVCNVGVHTAANDPLRCEQVLSDIVFKRVMDEIFLPRLQQFRPSIVLLSLGFDAAYGDPLGRMAVEGGFANAVRSLKQLCMQHSAGLVVVLEGGYSPDAVAKGVVAVAHALRYPGDDPDVVRYADLQTPKTWGDVRSRLARANHEKQQYEKEMEGTHASSGTPTRVSSPHGVEGSSSASLLPEDDVLLERHQLWCDRLITRVLAVHAEANAVKLG